MQGMQGIPAMQQPGGNAQGMQHMPPQSLPPMPFPMPDASQVGWV